MDHSVATDGISHTTGADFNAMDIDSTVLQRAGGEIPNGDASEIRSNTSRNRTNSTQPEPTTPTATTGGRGGHIYVVHGGPKVSVLSNTEAHDPERYWGIKNLLYMILSKRLTVGLRSQLTP
jgi:hypothetical protein